MSKNASGYLDYSPRATGLTGGVLVNSSEATLNGNLFCKSKENIQCTKLTDSTDETVSLNVRLELQT